MSAFDTILGAKQPTTFGGVLTSKKPLFQPFSPPSFTTQTSTTALPNAASASAARFVPSILQGAARIVGAAGAGAGNLAFNALGQKAPFPETVQTNNNAFSKILFGGQPINTGVVRDIGQGIAREVAGLGTTAGNAPTQVANRLFGLKQPLPFDQSIPTSGNSFSNKLFGGQPINTVQQQVKEAVPALTPYIGKTGAKYGALPLVAGQTLFDLTGLGGTEKTAIKILTATKDAAEAARIGERIGIQPDLLKGFSESIANTKTEAETKKVFDYYSNLQKESVFSGSPQKTPALEQPLVRSTETSSKVPSLLQTPPQTPPAPSRLGLSQEVPEVKKSLEPTLAQGFDPVKYVKEQTAAREVARGGSGLLSRAQSFLANAKAKMVDFTAPIEDTLYAATKSSKTKLLPSQDIHNQIDRILRAPTLAGQFAKDKGIVDVIKKVDNIDNLDQYLTAKHGLELSDRGITTGRNTAKDAALVQAFASRYEPYAKTIATYSQSLLDKAVDSGLISKELADALKARYPDYVPFQRVFDEIEKTENASGAGGVASLSKQSVIQKIEGSTREVESPIASLLAKTNDVFKQGEKNVAARMLAGYKDLPGNPFQLRELKPGEHAEHTISFLDNGVKRTFETTKEITEAAKSLNVQQMNILGKMFALPVRVARVGITGINLPFIGANIAKDQISAFINSDKALQTSLANPANFLRSLFSAVAHDDLYQEWIRAGGGGTSFDIARDQAPATIKSIRAGRSVGSRILYTATHPADLLRAVENVVARSEELTRIQQYRGTKEALLKQGMSKEEAIIGGARQSRDATVNFARRGEWGTVLNSAFLYLNAGIQGTRTLLRNLKTRPVQTATKIAVAALFPVATATAWNLSDPKRKAAYDDIQEYEKQNNIIIVPDNPVKDAQGKWNVIKIPMSQEINNLAGAVRRPIEAMHGLNPVTFGDFATALFGTVSPVAPNKGSILSAITPQAIKPTIEAATNQSLFTGIPQVPRGLQGLSPENQVKPYTSGTARLIGNKLNVAPIKVEEFIKGTFGGVGSQALNAVDNALAAGGVIPKDQIGGQKVLDAIAARFNKASGGVQDDRAYKAQADATQQKADDRSVFKKATYDPIQALVQSGKQAEADAAVAKLSDSEWETYKNIRTSERAKNTEKMRGLLLSDPTKAVAFVRTQLPDEQARLIKVMTDEEYAAYETGKNNP